MAFKTCPLEYKKYAGVLCGLLLQFGIMFGTILEIPYSYLIGINWVIIYEIKYILISLHVFFFLFGFSDLPELHAREPLIDRCVGEYIVLNIAISIASIQMLIIVDWWCQMIGYIMVFFMASWWAEWPWVW